MSRNVSFDETIQVQEFVHEDSIKISKKRSNTRADYKKKRSARQNAKSQSKSSSSAAAEVNIKENGEICICLPKSHIRIIEKQEKMPQEEEEEPMMMDNDVYYDPPEFDNNSIYESLPEFEESLLEVDDDPISIPVLGRNYRTDSFR